MKNKLPCELVRDLFPTYIDELTSEVTNEWIKEHVTDCEDCRTILDAMREPGAQPLLEEEEKEIDFLKKTRKRNVKIAVGSILLAFVIFGVLMFTNIFMLGDPVSSEAVYCKASVDEKMLTVEVTMTDSARVPSDIKFIEEEPGVIQVSCKAVLTSPWNNMGVMTSEYTSDHPIKMVKSGGRVIWADGEDILAITSAVYATRHPYVGDMPANNLPVMALDMGSYLGGFSNELQTAKEPYGWKFVLTEEVLPQKVTAKETMMKSYAYVLLAVIQNLGEVSFEYASGGETCKLTVTADDASAYAGHDIKACYEDIVLLQKLICKTGLDTYAFMDVGEVYATIERNAAMEAEMQRQEAQEQTEAAVQVQEQMETVMQTQGENAISQNEFHIRIVNNAEDDVWMMGVSYSLDGDWKGTQSGGYAEENTPIRRGDSVTFMFYPQDFEMLDWESDMYAKFKAEITNMEGEVYSVDSIFGAPVQGGTEYTYVLSGNAEDGYVISQ